MTRRLRLLNAIAAASLVAAASGCAASEGKEFTLYTHCGIHHLILDGVVYLAEPALDDGNANPPPGWGNPSQRGRLVLTGDGGADFRAGSLTAHFERSTLRQDDLPICS